MGKLTIWLLTTALAAGLAPAVFAADTALPADGLTKPVVAKSAPRNSDGHADLTGIWTNVSITPLTRPAQYGGRKALTPQEAAKLEGEAVAHFVEGNKPTPVDVGSLDNTSKHCTDAGGLDCGYNAGWKDSGTTVARVNGEPRTSFVTFPSSGQIPAKPGTTPSRPAAANGIRADVNDNPENHPNGERCLTSFGNSWGPVMLPLLYNNNYRFIQTKGAIAIEVEMVHDVRIIRLNQPHRTDGVRPWFGDTIGHWEGDTLVTETTNFPPAQNFRGASANLKVTEKFTRVDKARLLYQFVVEDPTVFAQPWGGEYEFVPTKGQLYEYACHEGNYALEGMLAGARGEEEAARAAKTQAAPTASR
jgi:hypothetical protein